MEELNVGSEKCTRIFAELDSEKGCGLIIRKRQGQGKPDMLYVMNFTSSAPSDTDDEGKCDDEILSEDVKTESPEIRKSNFKTSENRISRSSKIESLEIGLQTLSFFFLLLILDYGKD